MNHIWTNISNYGFRSRRFLSSGHRLYHTSLLSSREHDLELARNLYDGVEATIGLEVHAQLNINSKLFSRGGNSNDKPPNSQLDLFDISLPGTLPKLNESALKAAISSSLGLKSKIQDVIHFDRKNYFYTDMPAGYQITQYNKPVAKDGFIDFIVNTHHKSIIAHTQNYDLVRHVFWSERHLLEEFQPYVKRSRIKQIQLEQDSAKSLHQVTPDSGQEMYSLVDYNRSGAALIEVVFEPDLCTHHEASSLIKELILTLKALSTCDCELQEGSLRVDANVSIKSISGRKVEGSSRVELKNLNSLKALNKGIKFEIVRQSELLKKGDTVVQESRTFDTKSEQTVPLRIKEEAVDYRYVPEPNIPPLRLDKELLGQIELDLPQTLPCDDGQSLISKYNLDLNLIAEIVEEPGLAYYFGKIMEDRESMYDANIIADFLIYTIHNLKDTPNAPNRVELKDDGQYMRRLSPDKFQSVVDMVVCEKIGYTIAFELIKYIYMSGDQAEPTSIMKNLGWQYLNDIDKIDELCHECVDSLKGISKKYAKKGERRHLFLLLNKICELTDNKINIQLAVDRLDHLLRPSKFAPN